MEPYQGDYFTNLLSEFDPRRAEELRKQKEEEELLRGQREALDIRRGMDAPTSMLGKTVDVLSRGNYASAKFYNTLFNEEGNLLARAWRGFKGGLSEAINPEERLTFRDVIAEANPLWAAQNPWKNSALGFLGDIVVDPINALTFGTGTAFRSAVKITSRAGKLVPMSRRGTEIFGELFEAGVKEGLEAPVARKRAMDAMQEIIDPTTDFKAPEVSRQVIDSRRNQLRANAIRNLEADNLEGYGIFYMPQRKVAQLMKQNKLFTQELDPAKIASIPDMVAGLARKGAKKSKVEVHVLDNLRYIDPKKSLIYGGAKKEDRLIGVLVPKKYIIEETAKKAGGPSRRWASTLFDTNDLRFVVDDTERAFSFSELGKHVKTRNLNKADEVARIKAAQKAGQAVLSSKKLTAVDLIDPGGLKILGKSVITTEQFKGVFNALNGTTAMKAFKDLPGAKELQTIAQGLSRTFGLQRILERDYPEWMRFRRTIEVRHREAMLGLEQVHNTISGKLKVEQREEITKFLSETAQKLKDELEVIGTKKPTPQLEGKVFQDALSNSTLSMEQKAAIIKMRQGYNNFDLLELEAGVAKGVWLGYHPVRYEAISRIDKYRDTRKWQQEFLSTPVKKTDTFTKKKKFTSAEEAALAGFKPIEDAGRLYLMRYLEHQAAIRKAEWEGFITTTYGKNVPKEITEDLVRLGEKHYVPNYGDAGRLAHQVFLSLNKVFRASATIVRPAFFIKQIPGNLSQVFTEMGRDAMKVIDPTTLGDAMRFVTHGDIKAGIKTPFNVTYSNEELKVMLRRNPVLKNIAIEGLGLVQEHQAISRLTNDLYVKYNSPEYKGKMYKGMRHLFTRSFNYLNLPAFVEDTFRAATFIGALKSGHSEAAAMEIVDRALFNYTSGLTRWEQAIRNNAIPFYTFQKFGLTLLGKAIGTTPGRVAAMLKVGKLFYETWNKLADGETLSDSERRVIPGFLLEQPTVFEKFRKVDGRLEGIFRTFNNMTLLDVVNLLEIGDDGEVDVQATLTKGGLAQLAPFWKVPLETLIFKRELFSDKALEGAYAGNAGDIDYDKFIIGLVVVSGLSATAGTLGSKAGITGGVAGGLIGTLATLGPAEDVIKWLISWEEAVDPRTNKRQVFINPYFLHTAKSILPGLNTSIKISKEDDTTWDWILYAAFGIGTSQVNLQEEGVRKTKSARYEYRESIRTYQTYMKQGRVDKADLALQDIEDLLEYNSQEMETWLDPSIRGGEVDEEEF